MIDFPLTRGTGPITWWGKLPVYATTLLVVAHCSAFVFLALASPLGYAGVIPALVFSTSGVLEHYQIWQFVSYALVSNLSLWFLIEMAMLYFFGLEVERYLGRDLFLKLYVLLLVVPPAFLTLGGVFGIPSVLSGSGTIHFCLFLSFAAIAPGALMLFGIQAKWFAIGFFVFQTLIYLSALQWTGLSVLWLSAGLSMLFLRSCGVHSLQFLPKIQKDVGHFAPRAPAHARPPRRESAKKSAAPQKERNPIDSIDPILEKISSSGIGSLTSEERRRLEKARAELLNRKNSG